MRGMESESDEIVAEKIQSGDAEAFGVLMDRYEAKITRYASRFLYSYDDQLDAVQDVFLRAFQNIQSFNSSQKFSPWLYRIAHNVFLNIIRKKGREKISFVDLDTLFPSGIPDESEERVMLSNEYPHIERYLSALDVKYREVLVLFYFEEHSYEQIAEILQIPKATVGVRLKRAKSAMKKIVETSA